MNEVEKKEIEEMAKVLTANEEDLILGNCEKCYPDCRNCEFIKYKNDFNCNCINMCRAKVFSNAGYGKVEDYKKEIERLKARIDTLEIALEEISQSQNVLREDKELLAEQLKRVKQQAIKEFAKRLYDKYGKSCSEYYPEIIVLTHKELDDLLKEYGIGEK